MAKYEKLVREDHRLTVDELHENFPVVGQTVLYETTTENFK